ncbi:alanine racemase [Streptomyces clavuligerus]|uniref:Alanine racemase n=1 Tax=Streptomyces clavuligerus TaxID=1901 RepID=E2Q111_STRCL|nr:alanine racemase [Streptomyces clavuligerus]ANW18799.1 alanine racemase [Streptomyces clavuligerus]AXU13369.1 alanine racemase [Streptomyces clavuligerus]EFG08516.1 Alanine racemase [Streptomyces clavuligerus]MBY6303325.1 alanine racemase [Streptomyces clavuligerus]QCS06152.1 alanine racemase [Streptomyces clavuligerus]
MHRSEITLDLDAVRHNARQLIKMVDGAELWAVVKGNAYGHGAVPVAGAALEAGARALCVATLGEGLALRERFPRARIVVLGPVGPGSVPAASRAGLECVAHDDASLEALSGAVEYHIKVNLGLNRYGFDRIPDRLREQPVGVFGQFSHAHVDLEVTALQLARFLEQCEAVPRATRHVCNSSAALSLPAARLDAVRSGSALLGVSLMTNPSSRLPLRPALSWISCLAQVRNLPAGAAVGYEGAHRVTRPTVTGVVPVGYGDGFVSRLVGTTVLVGDEPATVIGSVSMDALTVALPRRFPIGTPVTLIGDGLPMESHLRFASMANWELCTGLSNDPLRVHRRILNDHSGSLPVS